MGGDGGSIVANVVNMGGVVRPGDATGVLRITGDYTQNSGTLLFELDGTAAGQFDQLLVSGGATFSGGQIEVSFGGGYMPLVGDAFALIQAGSLSNGGVGVNVVGLGSGLAFSEAFSPGGLVLTFTSAVPEPAQWASLSVGLALLMCLRRAKSARPRD